MSACKLTATFLLLLTGSLCFSLDLNPVIRISRPEVTAKTYSESDSAPKALFGNARTLPETTANLLPGVHPRIAFNSDDWDKMTDKYAQFRATAGSWSKYFLDFTTDKGPDLSLLQEWADLDTSAYTGLASYDKNDPALKTLAAELLKMNDYVEQALFMLTLHVSVNEKYKVQTGAGYLKSAGVDTNMAIRVILNWSKIVLSHYSVYGCDTCEKVVDSAKRYRFSDLWDTSKPWELSQGWYTGTLGLALSYDVLYGRMSTSERKTVRSAIGIIVKGRQHWGTTDTSTRKSPNCVIHPHRCTSNWAIYHANLYLLNCAIEGETDFDEVTSAAGVSHNKDIETKFTATFAAYVSHAIYPAGASFEDGYTLGLAFREGSLGGVALGASEYALEATNERNVLRAALSNFLAPNHVAALNIGRRTWHNCGITSDTLRAIKSAFRGISLLHEKRAFSSPIQPR